MLAQSGWSERKLKQLWHGLALKYDFDEDFTTIEYKTRVIITHKESQLKEHNPFLQEFRCIGCCGWAKGQNYLYDRYQCLNCNEDFCRNCIDRAMRIEHCIGTDRLKNKRKYPDAHSHFSLKRFRELRGEWYNKKTREAEHERERKKQHSRHGVGDYSKSGKKREHYAKVLGVTVDATEQEIKEAWRRLAMIYHPDKVVGFNNESGNDNDDLLWEESNKKFLEIKEAYENFNLEAR